MVQITEIRRALAALVADLGKVLVYPGPSEYDPGNGFDTLRFVVRVTTGEPTDSDAQDRLDELLSPGPDSVKERLESADLGDLISSATVRKSSGYQTYPTGTALEIGAEWTVETLV